MKFIVETTDQSLDYLIENTSQGKKYFLEGRWATANEPNKNGRVYPGSVMESALQKYHTKFISQKRALGELNHPPGPTVNLDKVSHMIENLKLSGNYVTGRAKVMDTPMGKIAQNLMDEGVKLGVSTRGLGSLYEKNGYNYVKDGFYISAIDIVADPSGPGCFMNSVMENVEYEMLDDGRIIQLAVDAAKKIDEQKAFKAFKDLMEEFARK